MRADLHIHSVYSGDANQTPEEVLERAEQLGLGAIAITDHNSLEGSIEALTIASDMIILPAMEISSKGGHILAYNLVSEVERDLSVQNTISRIHELGGIAVAPHPYRLWSGLGKKRIRESAFDGIEIKNGRSTVGANRRAQQLARSLDLPATGGSDAHTLEDVGKAYTLFPDDCSNKEDMVKAILENRTETSGSGRPFSASFSYGRKCIGQWLKRGMRKI